MDSLVEVDLLAAMNPGVILRQLGENKIVQQTLGYEITQSKTWSKFVAPFQIIGLGATNLQLIPASTQYPDSEHFIVTAIRWYQGANATLAATAWTPGIAAGDVQNGKFDVVNSGTVVIKDMPFCPFSQGTNNADGGYLYLPKPIVWLGQTSLQIPASFPVALSTANVNLRVELFGLKLI